MSVPLAPSHLKESTRKWWRSVAREWALDQHHLNLLTQLCECWDRLHTIRERIEEDGEFIENRFGDLKTHPGLSEERQQRIVFARLLRELDLDVEPPPEPSRPPRGKRYR